MGRADEYAGGKLGVDGAPLRALKECVQLLHTGLLPVTGLDIADGLEILLNGVGHGALGQDVLGTENILELLEPVVSSTAAGNTHSTARAIRQLMESMQIPMKIVEKMEAKSWGM